MIVALTGVLEARGAGYVQVGLHGVSLQVFVPTTTADSLGEVGQTVRLYTRLQVRDDELVLYGFPQREGLRLFHMLTSVSGIGPRLALSLLSHMPPEAIALAIASGDVDTLSRTPGMGRKSASRLVLELKGKLEQEQLAAAVPVGGSDGEVVSALMALGYSAVEARQAVSALASDLQGQPLEEKIRRTLQRLAG